MAQRKGFKHTEETKAKIRAARKLQVMCPHSDETKAKISAAHLGKICSEETRAKISAGNLGKGRPVTAKPKAVKKVKIKAVKQVKPKKVKPKKVKQVKPKKVKQVKPKKVKQVTVAQTKELADLKHMIKYFKEKNVTNGQSILKTLERQLREYET